MSDLGYTSIGGSGSALSDGTLVGFGPYTAPSSGTITSVSVYTDVAVPATVGVYVDSGGSPGALLAQSTGGTSTAGGWTTFSVTGSLVSATDYWIGFENGTSGITFVYDAGTHGLAYYTGLSYSAGNLPDPFQPGFFTAASRDYSGYITYIAIGGGAGHAGLTILGVG